MDPEPTIAAQGIAPAEIDEDHSVSAFEERRARPKLATDGFQGTERAKGQREPPSGPSARNAHEALVCC
jgi:hypothetical protein